MLERCYLVGDKHKSYYDCSVVSEWHNFQNFAKWYDENYPKNGCSYHLDKDLKIPGNRVYGPDTCLFVTGEENTTVKHGVCNAAFDVTGKTYYFNNASDFSRVHGIKVNDIFKAMKTLSIVDGFYFCKVKTPS